MFKSALEQIWAFCSKVQFRRNQKIYPIVLFTFEQILDLFKSGFEQILGICSKALLNKYKGFVQKCFWINMSVLFKSAFFTLFSVSFKSENSGHYFCRDLAPWHTIFLLRSSFSPFFYFICQEDGYKKIRAINCLL